MAVSVGTVYVDVKPSTKGFVNTMEGELLSEVDKLGANIGDRIGKQLGDNLGKNISKGVDDGFAKVNTGRVSKAGRDAGGAFQKAFRSEVEKALGDLPDIKIGVDTSDVNARIVELRAQLALLLGEDGQIDLSLDARGAFAEVARIKAELLELRAQSGDIEINYDVDRGMANLGRLEEALANVGQRSGGAFAREWRSALDSAFNNLPDVLVTANTSDAEARIALLRAEIDTLRNTEIGLEINPDVAIAEIERIKAELAAIASGTDNSDFIRFNATAALAGVEALSQRFSGLNQQVERESTEWADSIAVKLRAAIASIPDIPIDANTEPALAALLRLRESIATFSDVSLEIDLDSADALAQLDVIIAELELLKANDNIPVQIRLAAAGVLTGLVALREEIDALTAKPVEIEVNLDVDAFSTEIRAAIAKAAAALPEIDIRANSDDVNRELAQIRAELLALNDLKIGVDLDAGELTARLDALKARLVGLQNTKLRIQADADVGAAIAALGVLDQEVEKVGRDGPKNLNTLRTVLLAATLGFAPASAAVIGLSAVLLAAAAPVAAVAAGLDGIKLAGGQLTPQLNQIKAAVSATFVQGLQPAISNVSALMPTLTTGLQGTAGALSQMAVQITSVLTQQSNLAVFGSAFDRINEAIVRLGPPLATMLQNMIGFADIGGRALDKLGPILDRVGEAWTQVLAKFMQTGSAQKAIEQVLEILGDLLALTAPLVQLGVAIMAALGPALSGAIQATASVLQLIADGFDALPGPLQTVIAAMVLFRASMAILDKPIGSLGTAFGALGKAATSAGQTIAEGFRGGISVTTGFTSAVDSAVTSVTSKLGTLGSSSKKAGADLAAGVTTGAAGLGKLPAAAASAAAGTESALTGLSNRGVSTLGSMGELGGRTFGTRLLDGMTNGIDKAFNALEHPLNAFNNTLGKAAEGAGKAFSLIPQAVGSATEKAGSLLNGFVRVTAGAAASVGFSASKIASGLLNALGGGWGIAIAAAVTALSLFGAAQQEAAQKSAEFDAAVKSTSEALRATGGAITTNMQQQETLTLVQSGLAASAQTLGLNLADLATTALNGGTAYEQLRTSLQETATAGEVMSAAMQQEGAVQTEAAQTTIAHGQAAQQLLDQLGPLAQKYREAAAENAIYSQLIQQSGNSMVQGVGAASQLTAAFGVLTNEMSTLSDKAQALQTAMLLLTGGTLPAEQAVAQMRAALDTTSAAFDKAAEAAKKTGVSILDASGNIRTTTGEGQKLIASLTGISSGALQAATSTFEAAGGIKNAAQASTDAGNVIQEARNSFIKMAEGAGVGKEAAARYADQMGLIPKVVTTLLKAEGLPQVQQELLQVQGLIAGLPAGRTINIGAVSKDAIAALEAVNVKVTTLSDGTVTITTDDQTPAQVAAILAAIGQVPGKIPVTTDNSQVPQGAAAAAGTVAGTPAPLPVTVDGGDVPAGAAAAADTVKNTPAPMPVTADGSQVPGQTAAIRTDAQSVPIKIDVVGTDQTSAVIAAIRTSAGLPIDMYVRAVDMAAPTISAIRTAAGLPIDFYVNAVDMSAGTISAIRTAAGLPIDMQVNAVDQATPTIQGIRDAAAQPAAMTITADVSQATGTVDALANQVNGTTSTMQVAADVSGATGAINALTGEVNGTTATFHVAADVAQATGAVNALVAQVNGTTATFHVDAELTRATTAVNALVNQINSTTATFHVDADVSRATTAVNALTAQINRTTATVQVAANTSAAAAAINALAQDRTMTIHVNIAVSGSIPAGNAMGNLVPAGMAFAKGGTYPTYNGRKLTPMAAGRARIVGPNTYRVIGDRSHDDELYLPLNSSARSKALLNVGAARMGYTLTPMAAGGVLRSSDDAFMALAAQLERRPTTQSSSSFAPPLLSSGSDGGTGTAVLDPGMDRKLGEMVELLRRQQPAQIVVQDRSGDPTETARATQLALRLAR